ncbi:D-hexose-6-phosphate mutarotase [Psychromonas ossibalaenae]|uniref:D-hexose-6-phosphate mutarotase n=1 Tax=Psychromonas ossibalaenae TaxID=444922 RepID=UPI00036C09B6|nr:D-hexose-6-phosphate mutarotase [Psychromonas ossibalaenae]
MQNKLNHTKITRQHKGNIEILNIEHPQASALISLMGAQLLQYKPKGQAEVLWLSDDCIWDTVTPLRGGIPICWPWFGKSKTPAHGIARTACWSIDNIIDSPSNVQLTLILTDSEESLSVWPYKFIITLKLIIGSSLSLKLTTKNISKESLCYSGAFHSYFDLQNIQHTQLTGLGRNYLNSVDNGESRQLKSTLTFNNPLDYVFTETDSTIAIEEKNRTILVNSQGNDSYVIWYPGEQGAKATQDMPDDAYNKMLCVEPAIFCLPISLKKNESHSLSMTITTL